LPRAEILIFCPNKAFGAAHNKQNKIKQHILFIRFDGNVRHLSRIEAAPIRRYPILDSLFFIWFINPGRLDKIMIWLFLFRYSSGLIKSIKRFVELFQNKPPFIVHLYHFKSKLTARFNEF